MAKKLTKAKAREILHDKEVHGHPLTDKQRRFFGAVAGGAEPYKAQNGIEGTMGGLTDKGFNFNPAWGGAWKNGGWLEKYADGGILQPPMAGANQTVPMAQFGLKYTYLEPNDPKLPRVGPSSELAGSVGGENGKPAYLIPTMKYGRMQVDPLFEFKRTGEHLGGPFKTWQEAEAWERDVRHPYVEKGESIPTPYRRWGQFAMGGSIPGSVGFTYARVAGAAPSEGPRAKKTLPSAQNGMEMKFYQQGLDFKPKTISKNGGWLDKYETPEAQKGQVLQQRYSTGPMMGDLPAPSQAEVARQAQIRKESEALKQQQEARARYEAMPKIGPARERNYSEQVQANEQRRRLNEAYAAQNPEVTVDDSGDIVPSRYGRFMQTYGPNIEKFGRSLETPFAIQGVGELAYGLGEIGARYLPQVGEYLTTQTPLRNAYKLNPWAFKPEEGMMYRGIGKEGMKDALQSGVFRAKQLNYPEGRTLAERVTTPKQFSKAYFSPEFSTADKYGGGYIAEVPKSASEWGRRYGRKTWSQVAKRDIPIDEGRILKRDWLRGYKEVPKSISEALPPPQQNNFGSIYTLNPITALGDLGDYKYYRKIGSGSGIKDLMESGAIRSGGGYDAPYFSPNTTWEGYRGTFAVGVNPRQVEGLEMINKNRGGLQRGFKSSLDEIPLSEGATGVFRRLPFSSAYTEIPVSSVLDPSKRTLREKILLNPTLANIQHGSEEALRYGIKGSVAQYIGNELYGTEKDPTPLGTPVLLPVVSSLKKKFEKSFSNQPQQKEDGGEIVKDDEGYWNPQNWGKPVQINSNEITMEGVNEPLLGISDTGDRQMMYPGKNYTFDGTKVVEYPREYFTARDGKSVNRADEYPLEKLDNLLNFTNYNKPTAKNGKWLDKYK